MSRMSTERERDQHKTSWLTVGRGGPCLPPAGTLVLTTVRYVLDAINVLRPGQGGLVRRGSSSTEHCSRLSFSTASHRVWQELS
jgi:hypothetical protein